MRIGEEGEGGGAAGIVEYFNVDERPQNGVATFNVVCTRQGEAKRMEGAGGVKTGANGGPCIMLGVLTRKRQDRPSIPHSHYLHVAR